MHTKRVLDILLNVGLPLLMGYGVYRWGKALTTHSFVNNYLADGLWAYAFCSALLIVWNRKISKGWLFVGLLTSILFEGLQYLHLLTGTGDLWDVAVYFIFAALALWANRYFLSFY